MQTFLNHVEIDKYSSRSFDLYCEDLDICTFDLETTGLFPAHDRIMLSGMLKWENPSSALVTQYFDETGMDEETIIKATITLLNSSDLIVTYNGRSFDFPFLKRRAKEYGIEFSLPPDLDLFVLAQGYSDIKALTGSLSQKSVERFMGISGLRSDQISGGLSVDMYKRYLALNAIGNEDPDVSAAALLDSILLHNHDDVAQLARLLPICGRTDIHRFFYNSGFPVYMSRDFGRSADPKLPSGYFMIEEIKVRKTELSFVATYHDDHTGASDTTDAVTIPDYISFPTEDRPYHLTISNSVLSAVFPARSVARGVDVIDAERILCSDGSCLSSGSDSYSQIKKYPAFSSGYLVLREDGKPNFLEINQFVKAFLLRVANHVQDL